MTTATTPKLKRRPPKAPAESTPDEAKKRLEAVEDWTEQPAREAAAEIGAAPAQEAPQKAPARRGRASVAATPQKPGKARQKAVHAAAQMPWDVMPEDLAREPVRLVNFKCPPDLYRELNFFGGTTWGYNMTRILIEGARLRLDQMRKERGLPPGGKK